MKRAVLLVLVLVGACEASTNDDGYPVRPGGVGPIGISPGSDGGVAGDAEDGDAGVPLNGRVCLLTDLRKLTTCSPTGAAGLRVTLGTRSATTNDAGAFSIIAPIGAGFTWHVQDNNDGTRVVRSAMPLGTDHTIPVIDFELYRDLLVSNDAQVGPLQGSVVVRVFNGAAAAVGTTAAVGGVDNIRYDGTSLTDWNTGAGGTGTLGVVWVPVLDISTATTPATTITLSLPPNPTVRTTTATIEDQTITFITRDMAQ